MRSHVLPFLVPRRGTLLSVWATVSGVALLSGCGGGGSGNSNNAQIRTIDASANGGTAAISVNGSLISGNQGYFGVTSYQGQASGSSSITFSLGSSTGTVYPALTQNFLTGDYYSLVLVGRSDVTSSTDPRYPTILVMQDTFTTQSTSQAAVRIVLAAPDAGAVDVVVNGVTYVSGGTYKSITAPNIAPSGNVTFQVNQSGTGTVLVSAQTLSLSAGHVYTVFVVEPTVSTTPAYGLQETDDSAAS